MGLRRKPRARRSTRALIVTFASVGNPDIPQAIRSLTNLPGPLVTGRSGSRGRSKSPPRTVRRFVWTCRNHQLGDSHGLHRAINSWHDHGSERCSH